MSSLTRLLRSLRLFPPAAVLAATRARDATTSIGCDGER